MTTIINYQRLEETVYSFSGYLEERLDDTLVDFANPLAISHPVITTPSAQKGKTQP